MIGTLTRKEVSQWLGKPLLEVRPLLQDGMEAIANDEGRVIEIRYGTKRVRPCDNRTLMDIETVYDNLLLDMMDELEQFMNCPMSIKVKTLRDFFDRHEARLDERVKWLMDRTNRYE